MRPSILIVLAVAVLGAVQPSSAATTAPAVGERASSAACNTVSYGGRTYAMYRRNIRCRSARRKVRYVHRHKELPGWRCQSGSNFRDGGSCTRGRKLFGWHPFD